MLTKAGCIEACHLEAECRSAIQHQQAATYLEGKLSWGQEQGSAPAPLCGTYTEASLLYALVPTQGISLLKHMC